MLCLLLPANTGANLDRAATPLALVSDSSLTPLLEGVLRSSPAAASMRLSYATVNEPGGMPALSLPRLLH